MSMTGYGKGQYENDMYRFKVEIKSVNHRYMDINIRSPRQIAYLDESIKRQVKKVLSRGKIDIYIHMDYLEESEVDVEVDNDLAVSYYNAMLEIKKSLNLSSEIEVKDILNVSDVIKTKKKEIDEDDVWQVLEGAFNLALDSIVEMRKKEGDELKENIALKGANIEKLIKTIETRSPVVVLEYKRKLNERIKELLEDDIEVDKEKLSTEVAFFADKANIDEEIVRLKSHLKQLYSILEEETPIGRKLDFLIQEFNREINTIGSKSSDNIVTSNVVELKSEIEKIREQIQNIE